MAKLRYIFLIPWYLFAYVSMAQAHADLPTDTTLQLFSENGFKGVKSEEGGILLDAKYQDFGWSDGKSIHNVDYFGYKQNGLWGLMAQDFKTITKAKYVSLQPFKEDLLIVSQKSKYSKVLFYGLLKSNGRKKIKIKYRNLMAGGDFLISATKNEANIYFGIIDRAGKILIPFEYFQINFLGHNNFILTKENGQKELIKLSPKPEILLEDIDSVSNFNDEVAIIFRNGKQGLIRQDGKILLPAEYKKIEWNNGKHIYVTPLDQWTIFNRKGEKKDSHKADSIFYLNDSLLIKNTSSFAQIYDIQKKQNQQVFRADIKDVFGQFFILENSSRTFIAKDSAMLITERFLGDVQWNENFFVASKKSYEGTENIIFNTAGKSIKADSFHFSDDIIELKIKSNWGIFDKNLQEIVPPMYQEIEKNGEHYIVNFKGQFGVINEENDWIIPPQYLSINPIDNQKYKVVDKYLREFIADGKVRVEADLYYDFYGDFGVEQNGNYQFRLIDTEGNPKSGFMSGKYAGHSKLGILFQNEANHILLNKNGEVKFKINDYDTIIFSDDDFLAVQKNGRWGFINEDGLLRIANRYDTVRSFRNNRSAIKIRNAWGFINSQEDLVIQPYYSEVSDFENGTAFVNLNNKYGVIDQNGEFIIEAEYDEILKQQGFYLIRQASKWGIAKNDGKIIFYPSYDQVTVGNDFLKVQKYETVRILDFEGRKLIDEQFDLIYFDNERKAFFAKKKAKKEQVFLTDILTGKYP